MDKTNTAKKIQVKVVPNAGKNEVKKCDEGQYIVRVTPSPHDGKANKEVIKLLAKEIGVNKSSLEIIRGEKSKNKTIAVRTFFR